MKKIFFSLVALAAIAACSKSEVEYTGQVEIGFAPVSKLGTKAAVDGTDYPDALNMFVFANAGLDGTDDNTRVDASECSEPYFKNAEFTNTGREANIFGGVTPYYWPNVKSLIFSGYSKSGNVESMNPKPTYVWDSTANTWEINMTGYTPGNGTNVSGNNDLMWFPTTTTSYAKPTTPGESVPVTMNHACAWVTININGDAVTGATTDPWLVTQVKFNHIVQEGDVTLGETAVWSITDPATPTESQKKPLDIYANSAGKSLSVLTVNGQTTTGYTDYTKLSMTDLVVVPQTVKTLSVTYKFVSQKGASPEGNIVISETKEIPLTYNTSGNNWEAGKHYIYNVIITTQEIRVEPTVTDWTPDVYTDKKF